MTKVAEPQMSDDDVVDDGLDWRIARYEELGFEHNESVALANSTQSAITHNPKGEAHVWHVPLNWARVKKAIDNGCTAELALEIFINAKV